MTLSTRARSLVGSGGSPWRAPGPPAAYLRFRGPAVVSAGTPGNSPFSFSSSLRIRTEASTAARPWGDGGGDTEGARRPRGVCVGGGERSSRSCCRRSGLYRPPTQPGLRSCRVPSAGVLRKQLSTLGARGAGLPEGPGQNSPAQLRAGVFLSCQPCPLSVLEGRFTLACVPLLRYQQGWFYLQSCA